MAAHGTPTPLRSVIKSRRLIRSPRRRAWVVFRFGEHREAAFREQWVLAGAVTGMLKDRYGSGAVTSRITPARHALSQNS